MNGKTYMIKGTIRRLYLSGKDAELEVDFEDLAKDFTVNGNDISLNIKIHLDAIMKIATLGVRTYYR
jgi:hypothetical protein